MKDRITKSVIEIMRKRRLSGATPHKVGRPFGLTASEARDLLGEPAYDPCAPVRLDLDRDRMRAERASGDSMARLARRYRVQEKTVAGICKGIAPPPKAAAVSPGVAWKAKLKAKLKAKRDAAVAARAAEARRKADKLAARAFRAEGLIPIPTWVPRHLRDTYRNVAWNLSEQEAASRVRAMKGVSRP